MPRNLISSVISPLQNRIRALWSDVAGIAAVEFGLLAPLLLLMTFGTIELTRAVTIHKRFQRATSMVGDLVTRENQLWPEDITSPDPKNIPSNYPAFAAISKANLSGIFSAAQHAMQPYDVTPLSINVYQVWANPNDHTQIKVEWSYGYNWQSKAVTLPQCGQTPSFTVDKTVFDSGVRAVIVQAQYTYTPILSNVLPDIIHSMTWNNLIVMAPRNVPSVMYLPGLNNSADWKSMDKSACSN